MKPVRLEMEGFTSFRKSTVVDFEGTEIFVLSGPTGSGKSSIIDAITFALYGSVPRYDDLKLVHPVISQGKLQMKVRFDFEVNQKKYTATRVVKKTGKDQATTKEARLECGNEILAGSAREMADQVKTLLGLDFDQFNTCIVLPQGQFARFLHEKPAKRQELLKDLLNMQMYGKIGSRAREIIAIKEGELTVKLKSYEDISFYKPELLLKEREKLTKLNDVKVEVEKLDRALGEFKALASDQGKVLDDQEKLFVTINEMVLPSSKEWIDQQRACANWVETSGRNLRDAEASMESITHELERFPDPLMLKDQIHQLELLQDRLDKQRFFQGQLSTQKNLLDKATIDWIKREQKYEAADINYQRQKKEHQLHEIIRDLKVGDPCPVCERILMEPPPDRSFGKLSLLEAEVKSLFEEYREGERQKTTLEANVNTLMAQSQSLSNEIEEMEKAAKPLPSLPDLQHLLTKINQQQETIRTKKAQIKKLKEDYDLAITKQNEISLKISGLWDEFDQIRDRLAILAPPASERHDLQNTLKIFERWLAEKESSLKETIQHNKAQLERIELLIKSKQQEIIQVIVEAELPFPDNGQWQEIMISAQTRCEEQIRVIEAGIKKLKVIEIEISLLKQTIALHKKLAVHLKANAFERWLLQEAFKNLVIDGSARLLELSTGDYSFALDESLNFDIVDHRNADEIRSSRTLSGGETFLASLALALSLADQMAELASGGTARLESMFLDEGFGTLDSDTLDTVANTIEALSAQGRMIGLVTHVKDLADRMPVQFRVSKGPDTSRVEKIMT